MTLMLFKLYTVYILRQSFPYFTYQLGFLGFCFEVDGTCPSCLKLFRTMLEISNLACKYTQIQFQKYTSQYQNPVNFGDVSNFGDECSKWAINWKNNNDVTTCGHDIINNFFGILFLLSSLVAGQVSCQYHKWFWSFDNFLL